MQVAIDITPISDKKVSGHKVRGVGMYLQSLIDAMPVSFKEKCTFFTQGDILPISTTVVHYPYFEPFFLSLPLFKKHKTVVTVHDLTPLKLPNLFPVGIKGMFKWQMQKLALLQADAIIVDSHASKKDVMDMIGVSGEKVHVVYLAAGKEFLKHKNSTRIVKEVREKYHLPEKFFLYVGDVTPNKNLPRLLRAIKHTSFPLVMVGKSLVSTDYDKTNLWNKDLVQVQEMANNNNLIMRLGFVPTEDLVKLYHAAVALVLPSLYEGFGLPVSEAMACGCPVITTSEGSLPEVGGDAAFYVDAYSEASIADGLKKIFADDDLQDSLRIKGEKQVSKFSWEKAARETIAIYEHVDSKK